MRARHFNSAQNRLCQPATALLCLFPLPKSLAPRVLKGEALRGKPVFDFFDRLSTKVRQAQQARYAELQDDRRVRLPMLIINLLFSVDLSRGLEAIIGALA